MNIIFERKKTNYHIIIAEITETPDALFNTLQNNLSNIELTKYNKFKNDKRRTEWLGVRFLLKEMLGNYHEIKYTKYGKPFIDADKYISISHSSNFVSIIISSKKDTAVDIEIISSKILRTAKKFIYLNELAFFKEDEKVQKAYLNWCCKETLFKIKEHGGYDFKRHFRVIDSELKETGVKKAIISYNKQIEYFNLNFEFIKYNEKDILIVWH